SSDVCYSDLAEVMKVLNQLMDHAMNGNLLMNGLAMNTLDDVLATKLQTDEAKPERQSKTQSGATSMQTRYQSRRMTKPGFYKTLYLMLWRRHIIFRHIPGLVLLNLMVNFISHLLFYWGAVVLLGVN